MRTALALGFLLLAATPALADISGTYDVKFEEMSTNCSPPPVTYTRGALKLEIGKGSLRVNIDTIPQMVGIPAKSGKINAKTTKKLATTVQGLDGTYRVSGRVDETGVLQLVLVAEFTKTGETKTLCTQSWNLSGVRQATADKPADKKVKKSSADGFFLPSFE